jgi:hypothetical protein
MINCTPSTGEERKHRKKTSHPKKTSHTKKNIKKSHKKKKTKKNHWATENRGYEPQTTSALLQ